MSDVFNPKGEVFNLEAVNISDEDAVLDNGKYLRVNGAGNVVLRAPGSDANVTIPAKDGEYIPVAPGYIVRKTGTTVTSLVVFGA
jgi:hypothetical protein